MQEIGPWRRSSLTIPPQSLRAWLHLAVWEMWMGMLLCAVLALGFVMSRWHLGSMIVGATSVAQLEQNLAAAATKLDADTLAEIDAIHLRMPNPAA